MKNLTVIVLGNKDVEYDNVPDNIEVIGTIDNQLIDLVKQIKTKYISFIKNGDIITDDYFTKLSSKVKEDFDYCFINYNLDVVKEHVKIMKNEKELLINKPYYGSYIWNFIYKTDKFIELFEYKEIYNFNEKVDSIMKKETAIGDILYTHVVNSKSFLRHCCYKDVRESLYLKNVIYVGGGCNGIFNGYISWINNIGRCFGDKYDITILYDQMPDVTVNIFSKYFKCIKYNPRTDYLCERLSLTYSTYYYYKNIFTLDENYMFIHGNMSDYPNARKFYDDVYTKYVGVSKISSKKAEGYFPTDKFETITNPFKIDDSLVKPHLKLVSTQRHSPIKRPERIEIIANILNELDIPFTWNVFTDKNENTCNGGVIYRKRTSNPLPYVNDSDYFVLLSDSEALSYSVVEALCLHTKVLLTPLEAFDELGIVDGEHGRIIPFEYFEPKNKDKLVELIKTIYAEKDNKMSYTFDESLFDGFNDIFIK